MELSLDYPDVLEREQARMANLTSASGAPMKAFQQLHQAVVADGALDRKTKELIVLAIAVTMRCDGCIAYHVHGAIEAGATREEVVDALGPAVMMGGGPSTVYGAEALVAYDQFQRLGPESARAR